MEKFFTKEKKLIKCIHQMFIERLSNVNQMFIKYSSNIHQIFIKYIHCTDDLSIRKNIVQHESSFKYFHFFVLVVSLCL